VRAKFVNEGIGDILKPKDFDEIASAMGIDKNDPNFWNEVLIFSIKNEQPDLIKLAVDNGADQLWWESGGPMGGHHGLTTSLIHSLYKVVGVKGATGDWRGFHRKTDFKVLFIKVAVKKWREKNVYKWELVKDTPSTSQLFWRKYSPVDDSFLSEIEDIRDNANQILKFIKKLQG
jgi:hypothetical protein